MDSDRKTVRPIGMYPQQAMEGGMTGKGQDQTFDEPDALIQKIGIIGTGRIANRFIPETAFVNGARVQAVYNPHLESAERFANKWKIKAYAEPEMFYRSIDAVYIASPHETHYGYIKSALEHGKHVLCEKPMVLRKAQAEELFRYAQEKNRILFEGIKTAYCPGFVHLLEMVRSGVIGDVRNVEACFTKLEKADSRELTDRKYGGSFTELGSYCVLPIIKLFGTRYIQVRFDAINDGNGVDIFTKVSFEYPNGIATATCGLGVKSEGRLLVSGTKGYIVVKAPWWKTSHFEVYYEDPTKIDRYEAVFEGDGLRYEIRDFLNAISGSSECRLMRKETVVMAEIMENFMKEFRKMV